MYRADANDELSCLYVKTPRLSRYVMRLTTLLGYYFFDEPHGRMGTSLGLAIIGKLLGHTQAATTARYSHLNADPLRRAADVIANQIAAAMAGNSAEVVQHPAMKSRP